MSASKRASVKDNSPLDQLFRKTGPAEAPFAEADASRAATTMSETTPDKPRQTTILLSDRHLEWLDQKCMEARRHGGRPTRKAELIRSLLDLAMSAPVNLAGLTSEDELTQRFEQAIKGK